MTIAAFTFAMAAWHGPPLEMLRPAVAVSHHCGYSRPPPRTTPPLPPEAVGGGGADGRARWTQRRATATAGRNISGGSSCHSKSRTELLAVVAELQSRQKVYQLVLLRPFLFHLSPHSTWHWLWGVISGAGEVAMRGLALGDRLVSVGFMGRVTSF